MANLVGHAPSADVLLVSSDGHKFHAHSLILQKRAPNFFCRYIQSAAPNALTPREIAASLRPRHQQHLLEVVVDDVDSNALGFFIRSIYTDEEVTELGQGGQHKVGEGGDEDQGEQKEHFEKRAKEKGELINRRDEQSDQKNGDEAELINRRDGDEQRSAEGGTDQRTESAIPMTSFLELAECAEQQTRREGKGTTQRKNVPSSSNSDFGTVSAARNSTPKFIPICDANETPETEKENHKKEERKMFPIFIGMDGTVEEEMYGTDSVPSMCSSIMAKSLPSTADASESPTLMDITVSSIRGRAIARRRLSSVSSLNSLCSVDLLTPTHEHVSFTSVDDHQRTASKLATDLLEIYTEERDSVLQTRQIDQMAQIVLVETKEGVKLRAPLCTLWANSEYFRAVLSPLLGPPPRKSLLRVPLVRFSSSSVHFLLQFFHGGLCSIPPSISDENPLGIWELFELGAFVRSELFTKMLALNARAKLFHFFHRPCVVCVSAAFDALPKMELEIPALREMFDEALQWQATHFTRIWKGRVFLHLSDRWQRHCRDALLQSVDEENVVEVLLGCEKLQVTLPRLKSAVAAQRVLRMLADVEEYCLELVRAQFDSLVSSTAFRTFGKGLALNLSLLEDILPPLVHSLSADTAIRTFLALKELLAELDQQPTERSLQMDPFVPSSVSSCDNSPVKRISQLGAYFGSSGSISSGYKVQQIMASEWNPRFKGLCHRLDNLLDRHMLHFASSMLDSEEWDSLGQAEQSRIREFGLFVELKMPRAPLPRLSSFGRLHKRSSSVGVGPNGRLGMVETDRTRSLERKQSYGHAPVTSRPLLSTQMEEEMTTTAMTSTATKNGQDQSDGENGMTQREEEDRREKTKREKDEGRETTKREEDDGREKTNREKDDGREKQKREEDEENGTTKREEDEGREKQKREEDQGRGTTNREEDKGRGTTKRKEDDGRETTKRKEDDGRETTKREEDDGREKTNREKDQGRGTTNREEGEGREKQKSEEDKGREKQGEERGTTKREEDDGRERMPNSYKDQRMVRKRSRTETNLEMGQKTEKANKSQMSNRDEIGQMPMPSFTDAKNQPAATFGTKIPSKMAITSVQKPVHMKNLETRQKEISNNKKAKNEQKTDEKAKENAEGNGKVPKLGKNEKSEEAQEQEAPLKAIASTSVPQQIFDRQRTHTVMTVEENVRAGITDYLDTIGQSIENGGSSKSKKPQSIVRPMPQQQREEGGVLSSSGETTEHKRRTGRTAAEKRGKAAATPNQIPSQQGGSLTRKRAMMEREKRATRDNAGKEREGSDRRTK